MGCDIHIVLERKEPDGHWLGLFTSDHCPERPRIARRNYSFFTELAGVGGESETGVEPRGLPSDISDLARSEYARSPGDWHSASWLTPAECEECWKRAGGDGGALEGDWRWELLGIWEDEGEYRVVFWFDN